jgi:hypothetical protein
MKRFHTDQQIEKMVLGWMLQQKVSGGAIGNVHFLTSGCSTLSHRAIETPPSLNAIVRMNWRKEEHTTKESEK